MAIRFDQVKPSPQSLALATQCLRMVPTEMRRDKNDANETAFLAQSLEYISASMIEIEYGVLLANKLMPINTSVPAGAQTYVHKQWSQVGMAKLIANPSDDVPMVNNLVSKHTIDIVTLAAGYRLSWDEIQAAVFSSTPIDTMNALAARNAIERGIDQLLALGDSAAGIPGLLNNANIPYIDVTDDFPTADAAEMLLDLMRLVRAPKIATKQNHEADTLLLTPAAYSRLTQTPANASNSESVMTVFMRNAPGIRTVAEWHLLETANGGAARAMAFKNSPMVLEGIVPLPFLSLAPQDIGLSTTTNCVARVGGTNVYRPLACCFLNGTGE